MSAATELFAPGYEPEFAPQVDPAGAPSRRHLRAVPDALPVPHGIPARVPGQERRRPASVGVLHAPEPERAPLRLTRRGVVVLALLVAAVGGALVWLAAASAPAETPSGATAVPASVTVQSGDTLWSIAGRVAPGVDPREAVDRLRALNHLAGAALTPGQQLRVR